MTLSVTSGSFSLHASQLKEHEALARKTAAAFSNALSLAEYVYNEPKISEETRVGLHQIKLDLVAGANLAWRVVHNHILMPRSVALDNLSKTIPPIDPDQKVALLHTPFKGTTLFSETNKPYQGRGRSFMKVGPSCRRSGRDRDQSRSTPSSTVTRPSKSGSGQATMTVTVPQDSNKDQVQSNEGTPRSKRQSRLGKPRGDKKE